MMCVSYAPHLPGYMFTDSDNSVRFLQPGMEDIKGNNKVEDVDIWGVYRFQRTLGFMTHRACVWVCLNELDVERWFSELTVNEK